MKAVIDYAYPMMAAEKSLKEAHLFMLDKKYAEALDELLIAAAEVKMTINALHHMKEQEDALRNQATTV
jgi:hypothetical protein